jgi:hypothetical protein
LIIHVLISSVEGFCSVDRKTMLLGFNVEIFYVAVDITNNGEVRGYTNILASYFDYGNV